MGRILENEKHFQNMMGWTDKDNSETLLKNFCI
jgi:hypothetical protein